MNRNKVIAAAALIVLAAAVGYVIITSPAPGQDGTDIPVICHVGGTMRPVMDRLAELYTGETGKPVEITSAGSGELMATIEMQKSGDLYVCHDPFMDRLMARGLGVNAWGIGEIFPVIIVQKGNPKKITNLHDLRKPDIRLYLTDYEHSTLGNMLPLIFSKAGIDFQELNKEKKITTHRSGSHVANLIKMDAGDAALVWQAVAYLRRDALDAVYIDKHLPIPGVDTVTSATGRDYPVTPVKVTIISLTCSKQQDEAEKFVRFILSEKGAEVMKEFGFRVTTDVARQFYSSGLYMMKGTGKQKTEK